MTAQTLLAICAAMIMMAGINNAEEPSQFIPPSEPCRPDMAACEYWLHVVVALTNVDDKKMTIPLNGQMFYYSSKNNYTGAKPVNDVIAADGFPNSRILYVVNGSFPGPTLTVYSGQNITVHIVNRLLDVAISMHFHGIHQRGTPFADGVGYVSQCPINPGQTFSHNFKIFQPSGTYFYHGHVGTQRTMGMYGAFIIKNKPVPNTAESAEHLLMLQDYNHDWTSEMMFYKFLYGTYQGTTKISSTRSLDGGKFHRFYYQSGLINGRGRYHDPTKPNSNNGAPLTKFKVKKGSKYRFRVIGAGAMFPFRVSVDGHELLVVATDGFDVDPVAVESFIINPGERFDVMLEANQTAKNFMIRAETLEVGFEHIAEAILNYEGIDPLLEPTTSRRKCTASKPCKVLNCPFKYYPQGSNTECMLIDQLRGQEGDAPKASSSSYKEFFLNFALPGTKTWTPGSVNGRAFKHPTVSALTQMDEMQWGCDPTKCGIGKVCSCTYHVDIEYGDTVQMVFVNMGAGKGWGHPIHLHGHSFYVVKMGYAQYNSTTGEITGDNLDINCNGNPNREKSYCNAATWANSSWVGDNIPGLNLKNAPLKDTIILPSSSYVIIRFKADNPGVWIMHCHIEMHNLDGMTMLVREAKDMIPKPPKDFPTCRNFKYGGVYGYGGQGGSAEREKQDKFNYRVAFWACVGVIVCLVLIFIVIAVVCCCRQKQEPKRPQSSNNLNLSGNDGLTGDDENRYDSIDEKL
ncbi:uncharacterized protein LOC135494275 [Lineus longissimus]|uniref:uncharacterized protein LOC135494275 n=1 Tax=Lineus longissimus TaxID=88925 RepID=UPI00315CF02B